MLLYKCLDFSKCFHTCRLLKLVVNNMLLTDTMRILTLRSGGCDDLNCFRTVSERDEPTLRNAGGVCCTLALAMVL